MKNIFKFLIILIFTLQTLWGAVEVTVSTIDNPYDKTSQLGSWERNSKYTIRVALYNNSAVAQSFNRVEANLDFPADKFQYLSRSDKISGWTATNFFLVTNGHVQYQRAANTGEAAISIPALSSVLIYELEVRVNSSAGLGSAPANLDPNFTHVLYATTDLTGNKNNLNINIVADSTPPTTRIQPPENMHLNQATSILLDNDPNTNTNCNDLKEIHYTVDGSNPTLDSPKYEAPIALPLNTITAIKWFGLDQNDNQEIFRTATYRIDTNKPTITNISTVPGSPLRIQKDKIVTINFTAVDDVGLASTAVRVENRNAQFKSRNGNYYQYTYLTNETTDGKRNIVITATDHAGNIQTNSSLEMYIDNTPPTFNLDYIDPQRAGIGNTVIFQFTASEELNLNNSIIMIGQNSPASFLGRSGLRYMFSRSIDGTETSGWIRIWGKDLAGNTGFNLAGNNNIKISGYDLLNNYGEATTSFNIAY